jgi:hypothetical protein
LKQHRPWRLVWKKVNRVMGVQENERIWSHLFQRKVEVNNYFHSKRKGGRQLASDRISMGGQKVVKPAPGL